jgi:uncharacterized protein
MSHFCANIEKRESKSEGLGIEMETRVKVELPLDEIEAFSRRWRIRKLALFGSVLRDDFRPESDIDVLVSFKPDAGIDLFDLVRMEEEFSKILGRSVDIVTRQSVESSENYIRKREILESTETIYVS